MVKKVYSRDERISLQLNPPISNNSLSRLWRLLYEWMRADFIGPLSSNCAQNLYECAFDIARRYSRALAIYAETQARNLPQSAYDPAEYADYFNEKQAEVKRHAEALLALLKNNRTLPFSIVSLIGESRQMRKLPDGDIGSFVLERSLVERLDELAKAINLSEVGSEQVTKHKGTRGTDAVRADCIKAVLYMWIAIGGGDVRFQRKTSGGKSCGRFNDFSVKALEAFGIKHNDLEPFVRKAEELFKEITDSHLERLRNQCRVTHQ